MTRIYGFGNALIDIEISVSEEELVSIGIEKGSMEHISSKQKELWTKKFKKNIISKQPGGSIANSIYAASNENIFCNFSCSLGTDDEAKNFINGFNSNNTQVFSKPSQKPTGVCFIFTTPDGERTMASNLSANEDLLPQCLNISVLEKSHWLIFDSFSVCTKSGFATAKEALMIAKKNQLKVAFGLADISLVNSNLKEIAWVLNQDIDLLVGNEIEVNLLQETTKIACDILCSLDSRGAKFNEIKVSAEKASIVNTNGAGDALLGVFLSLLERLGPEESLKSAVNYATKVCLVGGPRI